MAKSMKKRENLAKAVGLLKLLSHPVRLSILCNLLHNGEMNVTEIVNAENGVAGQSQISQFLGKMRSEGLVETRKEAQIVYYRIRSPEVRAVVQNLFDVYCNKCY